MRACDREFLKMSNELDLVRPNGVRSALTIDSSVLCVDLDGTLLRTDTLHECLFKVLKSQPQTIFLMPFWLVRGRAYFKQALTKKLTESLDLLNFPRQVEVEELIRLARSAGKHVELTSAADEGLVTGCAAFNDMFDTIICSSDGVNLKAEAKADLLRTRHPEGFAYVGNSAADLPVWRAAKERFAVNLSSRVRRSAAKEGLGLMELAHRGSVLPPVIRSMRLHQWVKNFLVFVPLALNLPRIEAADIWTFLAAFVLFGLLTSGTYLLNDLLDVDVDRLHPSKRRRAIASGDLPMSTAACVSAGLVVVAMLGAFFLAPVFAVILASYLILTLAYSLWLKRLPMLDALVIAILFTLRIIGGMVLIGFPPSHWLLMFSIFFFFSLALMKRAVELRVVEQAGGEALRGRDYIIGDTVLVLTFGVSSGVASLVVFALFVSTTIELSDFRYGSPIFLWGVMTTLSYWMVRMWQMVNRGLMDDDPILYAVRDRTSLVLGAIVAIFVVCAQVLR
jgi:4-hydroxybenzoate polyprenyltransferase/phosphoserine phosphatase